MVASRVSNEGIYMDLGGSDVVVQRTCYCELVGFRYGDMLFARL
jgi:hypothetical protein